MKKCDICGKNYSEFAEKCPYCNSDISSFKAKETKIKGKKQIIINLIITYLAVLFGTGISVVLTYKTIPVFGFATELVSNIFLLGVVFVVAFMNIMFVLKHNLFSFKRDKNLGIICGIICLAVSIFLMIKDITSESTTLKLLGLNAYDRIYVPLGIIRCSIDALIGLILFLFVVSIAYLIRKPKNESHPNISLKKKVKITAFIILAIILITTAISFAISVYQFENTPLIPDVIGMDKETAEEILINAGLIPEFNEVYNPEFAKGKVTYCFPEVGEQIDDNNKRIQVFVSVGE